MILVLLYNDWTCLLIQFLFIIIKFFQFNKNNTYHFERLSFFICFIVMNIIFIIKTKK